jgi:nicotinamide mononucleotide transporter
MHLTEILENLIRGLRTTSALEYVAVFTGIASVWLSRIENIWVYPTGLVSTTIYIFLSFEGGLLGEASVNFYYTVMSIYGWILWAGRNEKHEHLLKISFSTAKEWLIHVWFFAAFYLVIFFALSYLKKAFAPGAIPWADAFASATAYTGMWLMARKKVESWFWWILTNLASIPLYFVKHYVFTSVYYMVLLVIAVGGWTEWQKRARAKDDIG